jgi:hypothetical protein
VGFAQAPEDLLTAVRTAVVDEQDLRVQFEPFDGAEDPVREGVEVIRFVVQRNDD